MDTIFATDIDQIPSPIFG